MSFTPRSTVAVSLLAGLIRSAAAGFAEGQLSNGRNRRVAATRRLAGIVLAIAAGCSDGQVRSDAPPDARFGRAADASPDGPLVVGQDAATADAVLDAAPPIDAPLVDAPAPDGPWPMDAAPPDAAIPDAAVPDAQPNPFLALRWAKCEPFVPAGIPPAEPPNLDDWLTAHASIANAMIWMRPDNSVVAWSMWPADVKELLRANFASYWKWYRDGMTGTDPTPFQDPPVNLADTNDVWLDNYPRTVLADGDAKHLYTKTMAQILVVELQKRVPWSILDYDAPTLAELVDSRSLFWGYYTGYILADDFATPGSPMVVARFAAEVGIPCRTRLETIGRLLTWSNRLEHIQGEWRYPENRKEFWGYAGKPPVTRIIERTSYTGNDPSIDRSPMHWTLGCIGTTGFLKVVLRAVNIPVQHSGITFAGTGHATPFFISERKYLSHGDDPYFTEWDQLPFPPEALLISQDQYESWFSSQTPDVALKSVGRGVNELRIDYLTKSILVGEFVDQKLFGLGHADSFAYKQITGATTIGGFPYTVEELERRGLWTRIDAWLSHYGPNDLERLRADLAAVPDYQPGPRY